MQQLLPHSAELEKKLLGMLIGSLQIDYLEDIHEVSGILKSENFYLAMSQALYKLILKMANGSSLEFDLEVCAYRLTQEVPNLQKSNALNFVIECQSAQIGGRSAEIAHEVLNLWERRKYIQAGQAIATKAHDMSTHIQEVRSEVSNALSVNIDKQDGSLHSPKDYVNDYLEYLFELPTEGLKSRFVNFGKRIGAYEGGNTYWICGAEKMGKSAFLLSEAHHFAHAYPEKVGIYFSLEMSKRIVTRRLVSISSGIPIKKLKDRTMSENEKQHAMSCFARIQDSGLYVVDRAGIGPQQMRNYIQKVILETGQIDYIFLDYFQIMGSDTKHSSQNEKQLQNSMDLIAIAKEFDIPLIGGAQVNSKDISKAGDKRPELAQIRGSSALQADGYNISFLYRDSYYNPDYYGENDPDLGKTELITKGGREAEAGTDYLRFFGECSRFEAAHYEQLDMNNLPPVGQESR